MRIPHLYSIFWAENWDQIEGQGEVGLRWPLVFYAGINIALVTI